MTRWKKPGRPSVTFGPIGSTGELEGGPFDGKRILRRGYYGDGGTLKFSLKGVTGRYIQNQWQEAI